MQFFMPMIPPTVTHQEMKTAVNKTTGKVIYYEPAELKNARAKLIAALHPHRPAEPLDGAIYLQTAWVFPADDKHPPKTWKTSKPDTDNLQKMLKDIMTELGYWKDDALVCCEHISKTYGDVPGIMIEIHEIWSDGI